MAKQKIEVVIDGKNNAGPAIKEAGSELQGLSKIATSVAGTIAGALSVGAFAGWIKGSIDSAAQLQILSQAANTSTTQLQQWAVGARTVGLDQQQLADILKDVNDKVGDFLQTGGGELADFFEGIAPQIGVTAEQFKNLSGADALQLFVDSLEKANLSQAEMIFYLEGMASDASLLLPLLQDGGAGMRAWADEAERMGLILGEDTIVQAKAFNDQLAVLGLASDNVGSQLAAEMLPSLQELSGLLLEVATDSEAATIAADVFGIALKALATAAIGVGSTIVSVGRSIGGLAAAAVAAASGELSQASEILKQLSADNGKSAAEAEGRIRKLWSGEYQKAGERAATVNQRVADSQDKVIQSAKDYQDQQAAAKKAGEEAARAAKKQADDAARAAQQLADQQESYVAGLEKQAATLGMTAAQVRAYELAEKGLTGALKQRAQAALAALEAAEKQRQADANAATNAGLEADYLRASGRQTDAAMLEIRAKFDKMRKEFEADGNAAGLAWIDKLIPVEQARVRLDEVQQQIDKILAEQQRQEQSVSVQQDSGLLTELDARERILDIHRQTFDQLQQIRPVLDQMAQQPGAVGESAAAALAAMDAQAQQLLATTSLLESTLRDGLTSGLSEALIGLADGTLSIRDAVSAVAQSVQDALLQMAANSLAEQATNGIMALLGGGQKKGSGMTAGAAAVTSSAVALSGAGNSLLVGAAAIEAAAASLAAASGGSAATGAAGAAGGEGGLLSSIGGWFSGLFGGGAVAAATGGHVTGPGTTISDSIPAMLSNWEYVTRAAVVQQPGALEFLHSFNRHGMAALDDWATRVRHNTGGLAGVPAPALPAPSLGSAQLAEPAKAFGGATLHNSQTFNLIDSPDRIAAALNTPAGQEAITVMLSNDPAKFRSILGV